MRAKLLKLFPWSALLALFTLGVAAIVAYAWEGKLHVVRSCLPSGNTEYEVQDSSDWPDYDLKWEGDPPSGELAPGGSASGTGIFTWQNGHEDTKNWSAKAKDCPQPTQKPTEQPTTIPPTDTPEPTATPTTAPTVPVPPTEQPTEPPEKEKEREEDSQAVGPQYQCVQIDPILWGFWNSELRKWNVNMYVYDQVNDTLKLVRNMSQDYDESFSEPTTWNRCLWATQVRTLEGRQEIWVLDYGSNLVSVISDPEYYLQQPEFSDDGLLRIRRSGGSMFLTDIYHTFERELPGLGSNPNTLIDPNGPRITVYSDENGFATFITDEGKRYSSTGIPCRRPEWDPHGFGFFCWDEEGVFRFDFAGRESVRLTDAPLAVAPDPDGSGKAGLSGTDLIYVTDIAIVDPELEMIDERIGYGSDWEDDAVVPVLSAFYAYMADLEAEGRGAETPPSGEPSTASEAAAPVCPSYEGDSVIDCLVLADQNASSEARALLAFNYRLVDSVDEFTGTPRQNTDLLEVLRGK